MEYYIYGNCTTRDVFSGSVTIILFFFFFFLRFSPKSNILQLLFFFFFLHSPLTDGLVDDCRLLDYTSISSSIPHLSSFLFSSSRRTVTFSFLVILNYRFFRRTGEGEREGRGMGALIKDNAKKCSLRNSEIFENWMALHS